MKTNANLSHLRNRNLMKISVVFLIFCSLIVFNRSGFEKATIASDSPDNGTAVMGITAWAIETQLTKNSNPVLKKVANFSIVESVEPQTLEAWMLDAKPWIIYGKEDEVALLEPWMITSIPWVTDTINVSLSDNNEIEAWMLDVAVWSSGGTMADGINSLINNLESWMTAPESWANDVVMSGIDFSEERMSILPLI